MNWNIHNDHAGGGGRDPDHDGGPDTDKILADVDRAATQVRGFLRELGLDPEDIGPVFVGRMANAVERLLDQWAYLRWAIEQDHAPLPAAWTGRDCTGPFGAPDEQLAYLRRAITTTSEWLDSRPDQGENPVDALVDHLVACAAAVDAMCTGGDLPGDWAGPYVRLHGAAVADPRATANGGAAAKAGWDLAVNRAGALDRAAAAMEAADRTAQQPAESAQHVDRARGWMHLARLLGDLT